MVPTSYPGHGRPGVEAHDNSGVLPHEAVASLGGHASRTELLALGCDPTYIKLCLWYRTILSTRRGWYALPGTPRPILRALRAGGRLACVSALALWGGDKVADDEPVRIAVHYGASRIGAGVVAHWSRKDMPGTRLVVDEEVARQQASTCRAKRSR